MERMFVWFLAKYMTVGPQQRETATAAAVAPCYYRCSCCSPCRCGYCHGGHCRYIAPANTAPTAAATDSTPTTITVVIDNSDRESNLPYIDK